MLQFFFFGCWNDGGCTGNNNLKNIINHIHHNKKSYEFGVILGDNVYNSKKTKIHHIETLLDGIQCINTIDLPLYIVLGNHDVTQCNIINEETKKHGNWNFEKNFYSFVVNKIDLNVKIIVIDTNLLADKNIYDSIFEENNTEKPCTLPEAINTNYDEMIQFLQNETNNAQNYNWIIVAGHDPLASFRFKNNMSQAIPKPHIDILLSILGKISNLIYICADTHNFQYNTVTSNDKKLVVQEIVAGTGGASPDMIVPVFKNNIFNSIGGLYNMMMHDTHDPFGYCDMTIYPEKIIIVYHKISPSFEEHLYQINRTKQSEQYGGTDAYYFKKYLKYRTKYEELIRA
jgi:hypothetical protein